MANMAVELLLKLVDQLSQPMGQATDSVKNFDRAIGETKGKGKDLFADQGRAADDYKAKLDSITDRMAKLGQIQMGFSDAKRTFEAIGKPLDDMTAKAVEFEKRMESIARAGGRLDLKDKLGKDILDVSKRTNVPWEEIAKGERHLVELGGGEFLDKVSPVRERLARLTYASESSAESLYSLLERYMKLGKMSAEQAMGALEINYAQGKKGAYELKNMAHGMPQLFSLGTSFGMSGQQAATDLPALLQILRQTTGSAGEADTRLRHGLQKLTDPKTLEKINEELGVDASAIRKGALAAGANPLLAVANAIADKLGHMPEAGRVNNTTGQIDGADPEKLGGIARDFYFRSFLDAFSKMRDQMGEFSSTPAEARMQADIDFASRAATAAGALERLAIAADLNAVNRGKEQLETVKARADRKTWAYEKLDGFAEAFPGLTNAATSAYGAIAHVGAGLAQLGLVGLGVAQLWKGAQAFGAKYPALGAIGENVAGVGKGIVKAPWDIAKGLGEGIAAEAPGAAAIGRGILQTAGRGLLAGALQVVGEWGVHKITESLPQAGRNAEVERFANLNGAQKLAEMFSSIFGAAVPAARAETMAPQPQAQPPGAGPAVDMTAIDQARDKAAAAGADLKSSLNVTAKPEVDTSAIDALISKLQQAGALLTTLGAQARAAAAAIPRGTGALHDGFETR